MNKLLWAILSLVALFVIVAVIYLAGFDKGWDRSAQLNETPEPQENSVEPTPFYSGGVVTRDSSSSGEPWFLEYTQQNESLRTRLGFENDALCTRDQITVPCAEFEIRPNEIVTVNGEKLSDYIRVTSFFVTVAQPVPSAEEVFQEREGYGFYGTITVTGYVDIQRRVCNPGDMCGATVDYVSFIFGNSGNDALKKFTGTQNANAFAAGDRVGIGCQQVSEGRVYYENDADRGYVVSEISGEDYAKLAGSTSSKPVQLKMTREIYTGGRGAPDCYSHFRNFDVL